MDIRNKRWTQEQFNEYLEKVRSWYPTGREVDLQEAVEYHRKMPDRRNFVKAQTKAEAEGNTLICPKIGEATIEQTLETFVYARDTGGADLAQVPADTYTRRMEFDKASQALDKSRQAGKSLLNGFPSVAHGVSGNRRLYEGIGLPVGSTCSAAHTELHFLISLAAGATEALEDAFQGLFHEKTAGLEDIIVYRQFVDRLVGWYEEQGIPISKHNKFVGVLTPPAIRIASTIIGALLAAEQGVKNISLQYTVNNCVIQDVAAQRVLRKLGSEYFEQFGYQVTVVHGINHFAGAHPRDRAQAFAYITLVAAIGRWGGASKIEARTIEEGLGVPTKEGHAMSLRAMKEMLYLLRNQKFPESEAFSLECQMIEREARAIIDKAVELGEGDIAVGAVKAIELGTLDYTYPINRNIIGKVTSVRDNTGAVRFLDCGNLPFSPETKEFHRARVGERMRIEKKRDYQLIIEDLSGKVASRVAALA